MEVRWRVPTDFKSCVCVGLSTFAHTLVCTKAPASRGTASHADDSAMKPLLKLGFRPAFQIWMASRVSRCQPAPLVDEQVWSLCCHKIQQIIGRGLLPSDFRFNWRLQNRPKLPCIFVCDNRAPAAPSNNNLKKSYLNR